VASKRRKRAELAAPGAIVVAPGRELAGRPVGNDSGPELLRAALRAAAREVPPRLYLPVRFDGRWYEPTSDPQPQMWVFFCPFEPGAETLCYASPRFVDDGRGRYTGAPIPVEVSEMVPRPPRHMDRRLPPAAGSGLFGSGAPRTSDRRWTQVAMHEGRDCVPFGKLGPAEFVRLAQLLDLLPGPVVAGEGV
jgi:hypothetical protein